jgi:hypothetical protein
VVGTHAPVHPHGCMQAPQGVKCMYRVLLSRGVAGSCFGVAGCHPCMHACTNLHSLGVDSHHHYHPSARCARHLGQCTPSLSWPWTPHTPSCKQCHGSVLSFFKPQPLNMPLKVGAWHGRTENCDVLKRQPPKGRRMARENRTWQVQAHRRVSLATHPEQYSVGRTELAPHACGNASCTKTSHLYIGSSQNTVRDKPHHKARPHTAPRRMR